MSYEGGGGAQGPPGPTGATGATGSVDFSGPTGAILWYDGTGVTGTTGFTWTQTGGIGGNASILTAGLNGNYINMDAPGSMDIAINQLGVGNSLRLFGGSTIIDLVDQTVGEVTIPGSLVVNIDGNGGTTGQYLGSNGAGQVTWSTPPGFVYEGITPNLTGVSWISDEGSGTYYYDYTIPDVTLNSDANVQVTTINGTINAALNCWVVTTVPNVASDGSLRIYVAGLPSGGEYYLSILVLSVGTV